MKLLKKAAALLLILAFSLVPLSTAYAVEVDNTDYYAKFKDAGLTINVYNWGEYIADGSDDSLDVNAAFEELTGVKVNYATFATNEELYAKLKGGGANYDIIIPSDYMISRMIKEDMLAKLDYANIPAFQNISPQFKTSDYDPQSQFSVPYTWGTVGIIYNTDMVTEPVDSWNILWDEKYKDNILMFGNPRDAFGISLSRLGYSLNTQKPEELQKAADELKLQKELVQAYVMDEIFDKMQGGEAALAPYYAGDAITMIATNPKLAFAVPKEGTNLFIDALCIPASSKQKEAAEMYISFLCEAEVAAENISFIGYSSPNDAALAVMDDEARTNPISYPSEEVISNSEAFINLSEETNLLMDNLWTDILSNKSNFLNWMMPIALVAAIVLAFVLIALRRARKKKEQEY